MAIVTDFIAAINQIAAERDINAEEIYQALEEAIVTAYKKEHYLQVEKPEYEEFDEDAPIIEETLSVEMDRESGKFTLLAKKEVVEEVEDDLKQISIKDAKLLSSELQLGDTVEVELPSENLGRIAAQTAKQVILQKIRESEKASVLREYNGKIGEVFTALMQRMQRGSAVFEIGKATAFMPPEEQIASEFYRTGDRYKVLLKGIEETQRGEELIVSRAAPEFLIELFRMEVPEIESGVVEIKAVAREAGSRSKMAVVSHQDGVDAIGSCVGQRGIRIANVMGELGEEKIDIIEWDEEIEQFIANALSPARVDSVEIDGETAIVRVAEDQLSLAIGREGQNVRLAWKLTGYKIDIVGPDGTIKSKTKKEDEDIAEGELEAKLTTKLEKAGTTVEAASQMTVEQLMELEGIGKVTAEKIFEALKN